MHYIVSARTVSLLGGKLPEPFRPAIPINGRRVFRTLGYSMRRRRRRRLRDSSSVPTKEDYNS